MASFFMSQNKNIKIRFGLQIMVKYQGLQKRAININKVIQVTMTKGKSFKAKLYQTKALKKE